MVQQEINPGVVFLSQADFDGVGHFEQRKEIAQLPQPDDQVVVKMLVAHGADVDGLAEAEGVHRHGGPAAVKILGVGGEDLAILRFDEIAPQLGRVEMARGKRPFEGEMIFLAGRQRVELEHLHAEQVGQVMRVAVVGRDVMFVHKAGVERADERAAVLHVELEQVRLAAGQQFQRRRDDQFVF